MSPTINLNTATENTVQNNFYHALTEEYGYRRRNIETEFPIRIGSSTRRADIVVFYDGTKHSQQNIYLIVEVKSFNSSTNKRDAFNQLYSYASACGNCRYGVLVRGKDVQSYFQRYKNDGRRTLEGFKGIPYNFNDNKLVTKNVVRGVYWKNTKLNEKQKFLGSSTAKRNDQKKSSEISPTGIVVYKASIVIFLLLSFLMAITAGAWFIVFILFIISIWLFSFLFGFQDESESSSSESSVPNILFIVIVIAYIVMFTSCAINILQ